MDIVLAHSPLEEYNVCLGNHENDLCLEKVNHNPVGNVGTVVSNSASLGGMA